MAQQDNLFGNLWNGWQVPASQVLPNPFATDRGGSALMGGAALRQTPSDYEKIANPNAIKSAAPQTNNPAATAANNGAAAAAAAAGQDDSWNQYYNATPQGGWGNVRAGTMFTAQGHVIPVDYNAAADTFRSGVNGTQENAMRRAIRWATDMVRQGITSNFQNALNFAMAQLSSDWQRGQRGLQQDWVPGTNLGWDATKFRYNDPGERYNDAIDYSKPTRTMGADGLGVNSLPGQPGVTGNPATPGTTGQPSTPGATSTPGTATGTNAFGQTVTAHDGGGVTAAQRMALAQDPDTAYRFMLRNMGMNPDAPGLFGRFLKSQFQDLLSAYTGQVGSNDPAAVDNIDGLINQFGQGLFQRGNTGFFGGLRNTAGAALNNPGNIDSLNNLTDQSQAMKWMQQNAMLANAGSGQLQAQAAADVLRRATNLYGDYSFNEEGAGRNIDPFQRWLMSQGNQYRGIFNY